MYCSASQTAISYRASAAMWNYLIYHGCTVCGVFPEQHLTCNITLFPVMYSWRQSINIQRQTNTSKIHTTRCLIIQVTQIIWHVKVFWIGISTHTGISRIGIDFTAWPLLQHQLRLRWSTSESSSFLPENESCKAYFKHETMGILTG